MKLYFLRKFPVRCVIWSKRGGQIVRSEDVGRRFANAQGETYFRLKKSKVDTVPISWEYIYDTKVGNKQTNTLYLYNPSATLFFPMKLSTDLEEALKTGNVKYVEQMMPEQVKNALKDMEDPEKVKIPVNEKIEQWLDWLGFRTYKNTVLTDYKGNLEKYLPQAIFMVFLIFVAISAWIIFRGMEGIMDRADSAEARWVNQQGKIIETENRLLALIESGKIPIEVIQKPPEGV